MLKFRCAYPTVIVYPTLFFKGDILIQPWAPQSSTETRLIPHDQLEKKEYDNKVYEEQLFHHNDTVRKEFYIEMNSSTEGTH
jgi:cap2 methyltransferase